MHSFAHPSHPPTRLAWYTSTPARQGNWSTFEHIQAYSSIFKYIWIYLNIFEVFLKNIKRTCLIRSIHAWHNGQDRPPTRLLCSPVSLRTLSMTTLSIEGKLGDLWQCKTCLDGMMYLKEVPLTSINRWKRWAFASWFLKGVFSWDRRWRTLSTSSVDDSRAMAVAYAATTGWPQHMVQKVPIPNHPFLLRSVLVIVLLKMLRNNALASSIRPKC